MFTGNHAHRLENKLEPFHSKVVSLSKEIFSEKLISISRGIACHE